MSTRYPCVIPKKEKMDIIIDNLNNEMHYRLKLQYPPSCEKQIKNGIKIEEALVKRGVLKLNKEGENYSNNNNVVS